MPLQVFKRPAPKSLGLQIFRGAVPSAKSESPKTPQPKPTVSLEGKTVFFSGADGVRLAGQVGKRSECGKYEVNIAIPNENGVLLVTDGKTLLAEEEMEVFNGVAERCLVKHFNSVSLMEGQEVKMISVPDKENPSVVEDYQNVTFTGYASTFAEVTPADRDGDYVVRGAFTKTIAEFMKNPVMLCNHENSVHEIAGSYTKLSQSAAGLAVEGKLTNSPKMRHVRFLVAEGHLKAMSMGGIFFYTEDGRGIKEVQLYEISLVAVPANQDALFQVRSISLDDAASAYKYLARKNALKFATK